MKSTMPFWFWFWQIWLKMVNKLVWKSGSFSIPVNTSTAGDCSTRESTDPLHTTTIHRAEHSKPDVQGGLTFQWTLTPSSVQHSCSIYKDFLIVLFLSAAEEFVSESLHTNSYTWINCSKSKCNVAAIAGYTYVAQRALVTVKHVDIQYVRTYVCIQ